MKRSFSLNAFALLFLGPLGCTEPSNNMPATKTASRVAAPQGVIRAEDATGVWTQSQVEHYLRQDLKLTQLSLTSAGGDDYTGVGTTADGRTLQLKVRQIPGGIRCDFHDDRGGEGFISFGNSIPPE